MRHFLAQIEGTSNTASGQYSSISGGNGNFVGRMGFVGGGYQNDATGATTFTPNIDLSAIVGGRNLLTSGQGQVVMGWMNLPSGGDHLLTTGPNPDRVFEIGSPVWSNGNWIASNAFEVSYSGHSIVYHTNGSSIAGAGTPPVYQGATYVESPVYAWGEVNGGPVGRDFGTSQIVMLNPGVYMITLCPADPHGGPVPDITQASITVTIINNDVSDITNPPPPPQQALAMAAPAQARRSLPDSAVRAMFGSPQAETAGSALGDSLSAASGASITPVTYQPLATSTSCGYATASEIGVLVPTFGAAYAKTFIVRTYHAAGNSEYVFCTPTPLPFYYKVCHR